MEKHPLPGPVVLFGSGETSQVGGRVFHALAGRMDGTVPLRIAVLETPAGFEPNSAQVAGSVADFLRHRLSDFHPSVEVVPARKRNTPFSPDDPELLQGLNRANLIFLGPGSPTYAVRQLRGSRAWHTVLARHRLGATVVLASAAMIAAGSHALPVYEIYKAGEALHWRQGLNFFAAYGLAPTLVPHWDNRDGGAKLDTSRCYMGQERFGELCSMLPPDQTIVGVDENSALVLNLSDGRGEVFGKGAVTVLRSGNESRFVASQAFDLSMLGPFRTATGQGDVPGDIWDAAIKAQPDTERSDFPLVFPELEAMVKERVKARERHDWATADELRHRIHAMGWIITDTPTGQTLEPLPSGTPKG